MVVIETPRFGLIRYEETEVIEFPVGLPGFDEDKQFLLIEPAESHPLKFLQSVTNPSVSFVCAPVEFVQPGYAPALSRQDQQLLDWTEESGGTLSGSLEWLAILCFENPEAPTANLLGPVVLHRKPRVAVQSIRDDSRYSARHPLFSDEPARTEASC
jgi:flagellar assembly factor FliW